jgi:azurin
MKSVIVSLFTLSFLFISSCGSNETTAIEKEIPKQEVQKVWEEFEINAIGNTMQDMMCSLKNITVKEGSWARVTLKNEGIDPAMIHNILFVNYGTRKDLAQKGFEAGLENEYIPKEANLIAASKLAQPGETVVLEFKAPAKGNYEFFCSYPGHSQKMRGYFFVK